jgi:hypothetical protein
MIENYRSGLCWDLFMANPEITSMIAAIAATEATPITFDDFDGNNINNGWAAGTWPLDPANTEQVHGGNYALKVQYDKNGEAWAYIGAVPTAGSRDFSGHRILKFWIYSSKATTYLFKVESPAFEKQFYVVADHWQEVTMKFGDAAPGLTNVSLVLIFPEPAETTGTGTFWLDDIQLK